MGLIEPITPEMQLSTQKAGTSQSVSDISLREILLKYQTHTGTYNLQNNNDKKDETHSVLLFSTFIDG